MEIRKKQFPSWENGSGVIYRLRRECSLLLCPGEYLFIIIQLINIHPDPGNILPPRGIFAKPRKEPNQWSAVFFRILDFPICEKSTNCVLKL